MSKKAMTDGFIFTTLGIFFMIVIIIASYFLLNNVYSEYKQIRLNNNIYSCVNKTVFLKTTTINNLSPEKECYNLCAIPEKPNAKRIIRLLCQKQSSVGNNLNLPDEPLCICQESTWSHSVTSFWS